MIRASTVVSYRLLFLNWLEHILFGDEYHNRLKERSQLHKNLLNELWLFGEQYTYGFDDISLQKALEQHQPILGREQLIEEIDFKSLKGLNDIPDIGLYKQYPAGQRDQLENLVIELKRPSCVIGSKEIGQIESYAMAIEESQYFDKQKTEWKLILLGVRMDDYARRRVSQKDREPGLVYAGSNIKVWVKEWNQVIQEAKGKLHLLKEKLELEVRDNEEGLKYLQERYKKYLPE